MTAQELLFVFVVQILDDQQATDGVDEGIFLCGVEMDGVWVFAIVTNGVFHFNLRDSWRASTLLVLLHLNNNKTTVTSNHLINFKQLLNSSLNFKALQAPDKRFGKTCTLLMQTN